MVSVSDPLVDGTAAVCHSGLFIILHLQPFLPLTLDCVKFRLYSIIYNSNHTSNDREKGKAVEEKAGSLRPLVLPGLCFT